MNSYWFDIIIVLIIFILALRGLFRGFVQELLSVAAPLGGIICALLFCSPLGKLLAVWFKDRQWTLIIAFLLLFLAAYGIIKLLESLLLSLIEKIHLEKLDKVLGFFLGVLEGFLICCGLIILAKNQPFFDIEKYYQGSLLIPLILQIIPSGFFIRKN